MDEMMKRDIVFMDDSLLEEKRGSEAHLCPCAADKREIETSPFFHCLLLAARTEFEHVGRAK
jgi:hypothetical protein